MFSSTTITNTYRQLTNVFVGNSFYHWLLPATSINSRTSIVNTFCCCQLEIFNREIFWETFCRCPWLIFWRHAQQSAGHMRWPSGTTELKQVCQHWVIRCWNVWVWFVLHLRDPICWCWVTWMYIKCIRWLSNHIDWLHTCRESSSTWMLNVISLLSCSFWHIVCSMSI